MGGDDALRPLVVFPLAASLIRTERGIYGGEPVERSTFLFLFPFGGFRTVTFENLMELIGKVVADDGDVAVKTESDFFNEGSEKEGDEVGL